MKILPVTNVNTVEGFTGAEDRHEYAIVEGVMILRSPIGASVPERGRARNLATPADHWTSTRGSLRVMSGAYVETFNVYRRP